MGPVANTTVMERGRYVSIKHMQCSDVCGIAGV